MSVVEEPPRVVEPDEERGVRAPAPGRRDTLACCDGAGTVGEVLRAKQLTADRACEELVACVRAALEEP